MTQTITAYGTIYIVPLWPALVLLALLLATVFVVNVLLPRLEERRVRRIRQDRERRGLIAPRRDAR